MIELNRLTEVPSGLLTATSVELKALLGGPTLIWLEGKRSPPLFVTVLQHGNETTGFQAIQQILQKYQKAELPRSMWLFIANVESAAAGVRTLAGQQDYNRSWPGAYMSTSSEARLMQEVVDTVTKQPLFASVDLHNTTGANPHYGCLNSLSPETLHLATLFSRTVVFFQQPKGVQSMAMTAHCPSVTLECGQAGENAALSHVVEFLDACLHMHHLPSHPIPSGDMQLLETLAVVQMKEGVRFGFEPDYDMDVIFRADLDKLNFSELPPATPLAYVKSANQLPVTIKLDNGKDIADEYLEISDGKLLARQRIIPSMATLDISVILQDCLFYIMARPNSVPSP